jgi:hypothetical protein
MPSAGCRQIAGISPRESVQTECASCVASSCAPQQSACEAAASCASRLGCTMACDPLVASCDVPCETQVVAGDVSTAGSALSCRATTCGAACNVTCGDILPLVPVASAPACSTCIAASCCKQASACAANAACVESLECARAMSVPDGVYTCTNTRYPAGVTDYAAFHDCVQTSCSADCAIGADFSCVGSVSVPVSTSPTLRFTARVVNAAIDTLTVPDIAVVACAADDPQCLAPVAGPVVSDQNCLATLTVPTSTQPGESGFDGFFQATDPAGTYQTALAFGNVPITQDGARADVIVSTTALEAALASSIGLTSDADAGLLVVSAADCATAFSGGMQFRVSGNGQTFPVYYLSGGLPSVTATSTDSQGTAVAPNLPAGAVTVTATSLTLGKNVGSATVYIRAGEGSLVLLSPTP